MAEDGEVCPSCGAITPTPASYCRSCGEPLLDRLVVDLTGPGGMPAADDRGGSGASMEHGRPWWPAAGLVVLLIAGLTWTAIASAGDGTDPPAAPVDEATTTTDTSGAEPATSGPPIRPASPEGASHRTAPNPTTSTATTSIPGEPFLDEPVDHVAVLPAGHEIIVIDLDTRSTTVHESRWVSRRGQGTSVRRGDELVTLSLRGSVYATDVHTGAQRQLTQLADIGTGDRIRIIPSQPASTVWIASQPTAAGEPIQLWHIDPDGTVLDELAFDATIHVIGVIDDRLHLRTPTGGAVHDLSTGTSRSADSILLGLGRDDGALWMTCDGVECTVEHGPESDHRPRPDLDPVPAWSRSSLSPDGRRAILWALDASGPSGLFVDLETGSRTALPSTRPGLDPQRDVGWLPDSPWVIGTGQGYRLVALDPTTGAVRSMRLDQSLGTVPPPLVLFPDPGDG